jgi:hypothetical protein
MLIYTGRGPYQVNTPIVVTVPITKLMLAAIRQPVRLASS